MVFNAWKKIGTLLGLIFFLLIIYFIQSKFFELKIAVILFIFIFNFLFLIIFPKIFQKNVTILEMKSGLESVGKYINKIVTSLLLSFTYITAVGFVWFLSRLFRKKFLQSDFKKSSWINTTKKNYDFKEMF